MDTAVTRVSQQAIMATSPINVTRVSQQAIMATSPINVTRVSRQMIISAGPARGQAWFGTFIGFWGEQNIGGGNA